MPTYAGDGFCLPLCSKTDREDDVGIKEVADEPSTNSGGGSLVAYVTGDPSLDGERRREREVGGELEIESDSLLFSHFPHANVTGTSNSLIRSFLP